MNKPFVITPDQFNMDMSYYEVPDLRLIPLAQREEFFRRELEKMEFEPRKKALMELIDACGDQYSIGHSEATKIVKGIIAPYPKEIESIQQDMLMESHTGRDLRQAKEDLEQGVKRPFKWRALHPNLNMCLHLVEGWREMNEEDLTRELSRVMRKLFVIPQD